MSPQLESEGKSRVAQLCSSLTDNEVKVDENSVRMLRKNNINKSGMFIATLGSRHEVIKVLKNSFKLKNINTSIQKDLPESMRKRRSIMLKLRKAIRAKKSTARIAIQNDILRDADNNLSIYWNINKAGYRSQLARIRVMF